MNAPRRRGRLRSRSEVRRTQLAGGGARGPARAMEDVSDDKPPVLTGLDAIVDSFATYEDYLDNQVTPVDMYYLENEQMARQLVELGYRGEGEILRREEFESRKEAMYVVTRQRANKKPKKLASAGKDLRNKPLLKALAQREEAVRTGKLATIIYVRDFNAKGHEVAGYIDYAHRLRTTDFEAVFDGKKTIMPTPRDLSYFNWQTMNSAVTSSENWTVLTDDERGVLFKHARDGKIVDVDPDAEPGDNTARFDLKTDEYHHVVLYDHITRRRKEKKKKKKTRE